MGIVEFDTFGGTFTTDLIINSVSLNKIYYIPSLNALWLCYKANITTTRYGYQIGVLLGSKASEYFGGYFRNENSTGIVAYVEGETSSFPCTFARHSGEIWRVNFGTPKNFTNKNIVINALVMKN